MEFTEAVPAFGGKACLSPNGNLLARLTPGPDFVLLVQTTTCLSVTFSTSVPLLMDNDALSSMPKSRHFPPPKPRQMLPSDLNLMWSPNSKKLMIVDKLVNRVFIYDMMADCPEDAGFILQESMPICKFLWSPKSDHILSVLDHKVGMRVWSLESRYPIKSINNIKSSACGIDFCQQGNMLAVLHRREAQDFIAIYNCTTWNIIQVLRPPESALLEDIKFATGQYSRNYLAERPLLYAWEHPCLSSKLYIFEPDGSCKVIEVTAGSSEVQESFGFTKIVFSPNSNLAALLAADGSAILWSSMLQKPITKITISAELSRLPHLIAFKERIAYGGDTKFVKCKADIIKLRILLFR